MGNSIITKFAVGTEHDIKTLLFIAAATAREKYGEKVREDRLEAYIQDNFNYTALPGEISSMSNQFLVVYSDGEPAGYARVTSKGPRPRLFDGKTVARIADFGILKKFDTVQVKKDLFEKCLAACGTRQIIWIGEYDGNPDLEFFESYGFKKDTKLTDLHEFGLAPVYLIKGAYS
jgi:hypothetical protein